MDASLPIAPPPLVNATDWGGGIKFVVQKSNVPPRMQSHHAGP
jgi:hypothetical protein